MKKIVFASLVCVVCLEPTAKAQDGLMDTCSTVLSCDAVSDQFVATAKSKLLNGHHREAARSLYPAVLSRKTSPLAKARAANALSDLLEKAGLYEYAAVQKRNATETTRAPASSELLEHARLMARSSVKKEIVLRAYTDAEALAVRAANMATLDQIIADYNHLGERERASTLQVQRGQIKTQADAACAAVGCREQPFISAKVIEYGPIDYPREARRLVGECTVTLNVTETGRPVDLISDCSDPIFVESAMIAVQESQFMPRYENGLPRPQYNVSIPFVFNPG